jgi:hypothetical protein
MKLRSRVALRRKPVEITPDVKLLLESGHQFFGAYAAGDVHALWDKFHDDVLPDYIERNPGYRPWAWWEFDATEPRRCVDGPGAFAFRSDDAPEWTRHLHFGMPSVHGGDDWDCPSHYENQAAYLDRLGMLSDAEREALGGKIAPPVLLTAPDKAERNLD